MTHPRTRNTTVPKTVHIVDLVSEEELPASEEEFFSDVDEGDENATGAKNATAKTEPKAETARDKAEAETAKTEPKTETARDKAEPATAQPEKAKPASTQTDNAKPATATDESEAAKPEDKEHGLGEKRKREDTPLAGH